jgi:hypothetical protein
VAYLFTTQSQASWMASHYNNLQQPLNS